MGRIEGGAPVSEPVAIVTAVAASSREQPAACED